MTDLKICIWNIQDYGRGDPTEYYGENSKLRNMFIAKFVAAHKIEVLLIQEVGPTAGPSLVNLARTLNGNNSSSPSKDWVFSYCGSAVARDGHSPPQSSADLTFQTDARFEGYAVLWRQSRPYFSLLPALHDIALETWPSTGLYPATSPLNLSVTGRPTSGDRLSTFSVDGGYEEGDEYPYDGNDLTDHWPELVMPVTSAGKGTALQWDRTRRPATIVVRIGEDELCPVGAYHAPSNASAAGWGAKLSGLSRELYVTNSYDAHTHRLNPNKFEYAAKTILGGDYNYVVDQDHWPAKYSSYTDNISRASTAGAGCTEAPSHDDGVDERRTTVKLLTGRAGSPNITGTVVGDYLTLMIDLAFFRPDTEIEAGRVNIVDELANSRGVSYLIALRAYMQHLTQTIETTRRREGGALTMTATGPQLAVWKKVNRSWIHTPKPLFCGNWGGTFVDWDIFKQAMRDGRFKPRQAAEFYQIFISDHLPLVVTIADI